MSSKQIVLVSAQVVLCRARKNTPGEAAINTRIVNEPAPAPEAVAISVAWCRAVGFTVGPVIGNSFAVSAPSTTFERVLRVSLCEDGRGGMMAKGRSGAVCYELPLDALPRIVAQYVKVITFTPPPDFGPY